MVADEGGFRPWKLFRGELVVSGKIFMVFSVVVFKGFFREKESQGMRESKKG